MPPSYQMLVGLDIAYRTFTLATLKLAEKAEAVATPFAQTETGFQQLEKLLLSKGCP